MIENSSENTLANMEFNAIRWGNIGKTEDFIGRDEQLAIIRNAISDKKKVINLIGVDGVGKSEICRQLYNEYVEFHDLEEELLKAVGNKKDNKDNIKSIFGDGDSFYPIYFYYKHNINETILSAFAFYDNDNYQGRIKRAWNYLKYLSNKKNIVLFIDGVNKSLVQDEDLIKLFKLNCTSIIMSNEIIFSNSPDLLKIRVGELEDDEVYSLFCSIYGNAIYDEDEENIRYITKDLADNHTLTVKLLASIAREKKWDINELVSVLERREFKMSAVFFYSDDLSILICEYKKIFNMLDLSYTEKNILEAFSVLTYNDYSIRFCIDWMEKDTKANNFAYSIDKLRDNGLIECDEELNYSMQPVIAMVIRRVLSPNAKNHIDLIKKCEHCVRLFSIKSNDSNYGIIINTETIVSEMYSDNAYSIAQLALKVGSVYNTIGEYERARSMYRRAVVIFENVFGRDHIETAQAYFGLAISYEKNGDLNNALTHYHVALEIQEATFLGKNSENTSTTYAAIAEIYFKKGKYDNSIKFFTKSLEIKEKTIGYDNKSTANLYCSMADVLTESGRYEKALRYYHIANDIRERVIGKNTIEEAISLMSIANTHRKLADYISSIKYYKKAIEIFNKIYDGEHLNISKAYNGMAAAYAKEKKFDKAKQCCSKSIEICENLYGQKSTSIATAYNNQALVYYEEKEYENAEKYFLLSLSIIDDVMGKNHLFSTHIYKEIGDLYMQVKEYDDAYENYEKAAIIRNKYLGQSHPETIRMEEKKESILKLQATKNIVVMIDRDNTKI